MNNPCYEMYAGSNSFSERESTALANYLNKTKDDIVAYVSLHTYGQSWMTPYGFTKKRPKAYDEMVNKNYYFVLNEFGIYTCTVQNFFYSTV